MTEAATLLALRFQIGQEVWLASYDSSEDRITCPDCGGTGRLRVTFHDETTVSIECAGCSLGYDPPTGYVRVYNRHPVARQTTVIGVEVRDGKIEWRTQGHYCPDDGDLFETEEAAMARALEKAADADRKEREKIATKEKPTRTWAWNAHYHRKEIKRAQHSLEYHGKKLAAANLKTRAEKAAAQAPAVAAGDGK